MTSRLTPPAEPLSDGVILLRTWEERDVDQILDACQDTSIQCYIPIPRPYHRADAVGYVARTARQWEDGSKAAFAVVDPADDAVLWGAIVLALSGATGQAAYWVVPSVRRGGIASRALALVTHWAFAELRLGVVLLEIDPTNVGSIRVAESAGYREAGHLDVNFATGERNHLLFSRLFTDHVQAGLINP